MWVRINDSHWNLASIARVTCDEKLVGKSWADFVFATVMLASGKEVGVSQDDYDELVLAIEKLNDDDLAL